ncbi:MAG: bis(5'-nucleosyl)-tetraphosphatase (symmetrical) YqeK, partial [Bacillota bacterium]
DSMIMFSKWVEPQKIAKEVTLLVAERKGYSGLDAAIANAEKDYGAQIVRLNCKLRKISSTELKGRLELNYNLSDYIMPEIADYIIANKLYKNYNNVVEYLKSKLTERTYNHSVRTAIFALKYANILGLSYEKVFLASLLHDVAKNIKFSESDYPNTNNSVKHQYHARILLENELHITDDDIIDAVEFHTTGKPNMSTLGKLVYVADKLEEHRDYPSVNTLRSTVDADFDRGFAMVVKNQLEFLKNSTQSIDSLTMQCALWYNVEEI